MEVAQLNSLTIFCGAMKSGKSKPLIERYLDELNVKHGKPIAFRMRNLACDKPVIKSRFLDLSIEAHLIDQEEDILTILQDQKDATLVLVDEVQFLGEMTVTVFSQVLMKFPVVAAGLDLNYRSLPFGPTGALLAMADEVHKLMGICDVCYSSNARFTQRLTDNQPSSAFEMEVIAEGTRAEVVYQTRCSRHYIPPPDLDEWLKVSWK